MNRLNELANWAAEVLPEGYTVNLSVGREWGDVDLIRYDGSSVCMNDGELDIEDQFKAAVRLALDEDAAEKLLEKEKNERQTP